MIWSDESHFALFNRKSCTYVRPLGTEANEPSKFMPKVNGGGGHVRIDGKRRKGKYRKVKMSKKKLENIEKENVDT